MKNKAHVIIPKYVGAIPPELYKKLIAVSVHSEIQYRANTTEYNKGYLEGVETIITILNNNTLDTEGREQVKEIHYQMRATATEKKGVYEKTISRIKGLFKYRK